MATPTLKTKQKQNMNTKSTQLLFLLLLFFIPLSQAQQAVCGHELVRKSMAAKHPGYHDAVHRTFEQAKIIGAESRANRTAAVYTIPIVVHVVWSEDEENLADSTIMSQIAVLNEDYRRLNADASNIRPMFEDVVGDPMIEFDLVDIVRVQTTETFEVDLLGSLPDNVKVTADGGSDAYDVETHLNIWICHIQPITIAGIPLGQVLGYAYPPDGLPHWPDDISAPSPELDGVVLDYRIVGRYSGFEVDLGTGPLEIKGRTATHEVGHYLGLRHAWGDGGDIFGTTDSCGEDDGVEDTPNTGSQANFDCDPTRNTCNDGMDDMPDMIENYMDYAAESCMNSFTMGQIDIIRGVLESERCKLVGACDLIAVQTVDKSHLLEAFPNPTAGTLQLQLEGYELADFDVQLQNITGQTVNIPAINNQELDLSGLTNGIYLISLRKDDVHMVKKISVLK